MFNRHPYGILTVLLGAAVILNVAIGSVFVPPASILQMLAGSFGVSVEPDWPAAFETIIFKIRLPHMALVALTGAALSGSGAAYQGLFRNPLADPYLIGVASGAGLGAVLALTLQWPSSMLGFYAIPVAAFVGALLTVSVVYSLARVNRAIPTTTLILAGVAVSSFATSLSSFLMLSSSDELYRAMAWLLGGGSAGGWQPFFATLPYVVLGCLVLIFSGYALNVLQFGDDQARQLGLPVERVKVAIVLAASLTTAAAVSFSGLIGFIGLIVPHLVRMLWGQDYRHLIPQSIMGGAVALLAADMLARTVLAPQILPVGIVTALAGAPFFLWILRRTKSQFF